MIKLYKYLNAFKFAVIGVFFFVFLQTLSDLYLPTLMSDVINDGVMKGNTDYILKTGGYMLIVAGLGAVCSIIAAYLSATASTGLGTVIRNKIFNKVEAFSLQEFDNIGNATLITRTTNDINQVQQVTIMIMRMMISAPMMAIGGIILAMREDKPLTWVLAIAIPVLTGVIIFIARKMMPLFKLVQKKIDRINLVMREKLTGIRVIRAFDKTEYESERFDQANLDLTNNYIKVNKIMAFMMPSIMLIMSLTSLSVIWFGGIRISTGEMDLGALTAFTQYAMQIMMSMLMMAIMFIMVPRAQAAAVRINEVLEIDPKILDAKQPKMNSNNQGVVEFKNVTFRYTDSEEPTLSDISFTAKPGEITAIIGSTGAGKSTLINLIPRFYDIQSGNILIDGMDVREMTQEKLRAKIGLVPQKAFLFTGTISDNIRFGNPDASDEEVVKAAQIAQAADFIENMDNKYDHEISQGGTNVSGGQKQRLSIARALVRRPEIYLFDDSFSALDYKTDSMLRSALKTEIGNATFIIVAQRVGTVMDADKILVMDEGRLVGVGKHKELLENCAVYKEIVLSQLSEEEIA